jgi:hypothetical protein
MPDRIIPTIEELLLKIAELPRQPVAFEAYWDGDSYGWMIILAAILESDNYPGYEDIWLFDLRISDFRLFNGEFPPWPESRIANEMGHALGAKFGLPFYFPSPNHPEDDCPRWWEQARGSPCRRCSILLYQDNGVPWKGCCYFCHQAEERGEAPHMRVRNTKRWWQFWNR